MTSGPRRFVTVAAGLGSVAVVVGAVAVRWRDLVALYHLRRLAAKPERLIELLDADEGSVERAALGRYVRSARGKEVLLGTYLANAAGVDPHLRRDLEQIAGGRGGWTLCWHSGREWRRSSRILLERGGALRSTFGSGARGERSRILRRLQDLMIEASFVGDTHSDHAGLEFGVFSRDDDAEGATRTFLEPFVRCEGWSSEAALVIMRRGTADRGAGD
jgi:hypothetical protein